MARWKRWFAAPFVAVAALVVILFVLGLIFSKLLVEIWWFNSVGYEAYFWQRALYQYAVLISVSLFFFLIFFLNFWVASRLPRHNASSRHRLGGFPKILPASSKDVPVGFHVGLHAFVPHPGHSYRSSALSAMGIVPALLFARLRNVRAGIRKGHTAIISSPTPSTPCCRAGSCSPSRSCSQAS